MRLFRIGKKLQAIEVMSEDLDYRVNQSAQMKPLDDIDETLAQKFFSLTDKLGLDCCAADFKTCPETGKLLFLEVNAGPMFAAFDLCSNGKISTMIFEELNVI